MAATADQFNFDGGGSITVNSTVTNPETINAAIAVNGGLNVTVSNAAAAGLTLAGVISGTGPVAITNAGAIALNAQNTYTGGTTLLGGTQGQVRIGASTVGGPGSITSGPFGTGTITAGGSLPQFIMPIGATERLPTIGNGTQPEFSCRTVRRWIRHRAA